MDYEEHDGYTDAGQYPGSYRRVRGAPGPAVEHSEAPSVAYTPTANSKFRELRSRAKAIVDAWERGLPKITHSEKRELSEFKLSLLRLVEPMLESAHALGRDSVTGTPTLRYCPDCPKGKAETLAKGKQLCAQCRVQRWRIASRLCMRRKREREKDNAKC